eukprot:5457553-Amphidinium_carterae.1
MFCWLGCKEPKNAIILFHQEAKILNLVGNSLQTFAISGASSSLVGVKWGLRCEGDTATACKNYDAEEGLCSKTALQNNSVSWETSFLSGLKKAHIVLGVLGDLGKPQSKN